MQLSEAREILERHCKLFRGGDKHCDAIDTILAAHASEKARADEAERELDQALERWPGDGSPGDEIGLVNGKYCVIVPDVRLHESEVKRFTNRIDAARCAAGLPEKGAASDAES